MSADRWFGLLLLTAALIVWAVCEAHEKILAYRARLDWDRHTATMLATVAYSCNCGACSADYGTDDEFDVSDRAFLDSWGIA